MQHRAATLISTDLWSSRTAPSPTSTKTSLSGVWHWSYTILWNSRRYPSKRIALASLKPRFLQFPIHYQICNFPSNFLVYGWSHKYSSQTWTLKRVYLEPGSHETRLIRISSEWLLTPKFSRWEALRRPRSLNISTRWFH